MRRTCVLIWMTLGTSSLWRGGGRGGRGGGGRKGEGEWGGRGGVGRERKEKEGSVMQTGMLVWLTGVSEEEGETQKAFNQKRK